MRRHNNLSVDTLDALLSDGVRRGIGHLTAEDTVLNGRTIRLHGKDVLNFGSCSYLGLESDPRLRDGVIDAVTRYGTQFSCSRVYVSAPPYAELEALLGRVLDSTVLCTPTTTLGHLAALPVIVADDDVVILDQMAHNSVQLAARTISQLRSPVQTVRHNRMDLLEARLRALSARPGRIWYLADGIYSMYGDRAPIEDLNTLLQRYPQLHLYIDDAHGMSWCGARGSGSVLDRLDDRDRVVLATSLVKAFAAGGGAIACADRETIRRVRTCGTTMLFSGPIQPPMLGAAIASARIHLSSEIDRMQAELRERIVLRNALLDTYEIPVMSEPLTPICFVAVGRTEIAYQMVRRLLDEGYFTNVAAFPAVSMKRAGVRFTVTRHHAPEDLRALVVTIATVLREELARRGSSLEETCTTFSLAQPRAVPA